MRVNVRQTVGGENSDVTRFYVIGGERLLAYMKSDEDDTCGILRTCVSADPTV